MLINVWESHENKFCSLYSKLFLGLDRNEKEDAIMNDKENYSEVWGEYLLLYIPRLRSG